MIRLVMLLGLYLASSYSLYAQLSNHQARISKVDIRQIDDRIFVPYTIANGRESDRYVVWVNFFNETNELLGAKTIQGDIDLVKGNGDKLVSWDAKADGFVINEKIYAQVNAKVLPQANTGKALAQSTLFPGAGQYQYRKGRPHWLKGALAYGLLGGSAGMYVMATNEYNQYAASNLPSAQDQNYQKAQDYWRNSLIMGGVAAAVWLIDYAGIFSKSAKYKNISPQVAINSSEFKHYTASSLSKHINNRGLPPNLFAELYFHDANNNGILEAREIAELKIVLSNQGSGDAMNLVVDVGTNVYDKSLKMENKRQTITQLKPRERKEIIIPISTDIDLRTAEHKFSIKVSEQFGYDMDPAYLMLNAYAYQPPKFSVSGHEVIDIGAGTFAIKPDGKLQAGEQVKVKLYVQNIGQGEAKDAAYSLSTTDDNIFLTQSEGKLGTIAPGEVKELVFNLSPNRRVSTTENLPIYLNIKESIGRGNLKKEQLPIALDQTPPKPNIVQVKSDVESLRQDIARFEYTSNKFKTSVENVINISNVIPSTTKRPKSIGVVIGIAQYRDLPPAPYSDNDARIMREYFEKVLGVEQVIMFTNNQVSGFFFDDIFNPELGELRKAVVKGETEVFVYYSGHGVPDKDGRNIFLFPHDGRIARLETQGYNIEKLYANLSKLEAKHVTLIMDACFSGVTKSSGRFATENITGEKAVRLRPKFQWIEDPNFTVISSSTGDETSLGFDETETGLFTYYLAAGLSGEADSNKDQVITVGELKAYVIENVKETSVIISGLQTPMFFGDDDRVLVTY